jgi:hypothetical protein
MTTKELASNPRAAEVTFAIQRRGYFSLIWLVLAGFFIVCHGCHGDEDNELSAPLDTPRHARRMADEPQQATVDSVRASVALTPRN